MLCGEKWVVILCTLYLYFFHPSIPQIQSQRQLQEKVTGCLKLGSHSKNVRGRSCLQGCLQTQRLNVSSIYQPLLHSKRSCSSKIGFLNWGWARRMPKIILETKGSVWWCLRLSRPSLHLKNLNPISTSTAQPSIGTKACSILQIFDTISATDVHVASWGSMVEVVVRQGVTGSHMGSHFPGMNRNVWNCDLGSQSQHEREREREKCSVKFWNRTKSLFLRPSSWTNQWPSHW